MIENFLEMIVVERGASFNTVEAYRRDLKDFSRFLEGASLQQASANDLKNYLAHQDLSPSSVARKLSALRQFYRFLIGEGERGDDPTSLIDSPRSGRPLPKTLTEADVIKLLEGAQQDPSPEGKRLHALLEILYAAGLRVSELVSLSYSMAVRGGEYLLVTGKGDKERLAPMNLQAKKALAAYLPFRPLFCTGAESPWLFPSTKGHLTRQRFGQLLKELAVKVGLDSAKVSPHIIRHAFASHLLSHGADLISIQKMLGHADISTTQVYTHVIQDQLRALVYDHHPLQKEDI